MEKLPGMSDREVLEGMTAESLVDLILADGERVTEIETRMNLASEVLEGIHSVTVEEVLDQRRDKNNDKTKAISP